MDLINLYNFNMYQQLLFLDVRENVNTCANFQIGTNKDILLLLSLLFLNTTIKTHKKNNTYVVFNTICAKRK